MLELVSSRRGAVAGRAAACGLRDCSSHFSTASACSMALMSRSSSNAIVPQDYLTHQCICITGSTCGPLFHDDMEAVALPLPHKHMPGPYGQWPAAYDATDSELVSCQSWRCK